MIAVHPNNDPQDKGMAQAKAYALLQEDIKPVFWSLSFVCWSKILT